MTRRAAISLWVLLLLVLAAAGVTLAATFGLLGYMATLLGAEKSGVFLFGCALVPMLLVGYIGRVIHERARQRPVGGRLGQVEDALSRAAGSVHHARKTLDKHQRLMQMERREGLDQ